ncbi:hypothetical protein D3C80_1646460 [compost metagenome]
MFKADQLAEVLKIGGVLEGCRHLALHGLHRRETAQGPNRITWQVENDAFFRALSVTQVQVQTIDHHPAQCGQQSREGRQVIARRCCCALDHLAQGDLYMAVDIALEGRDLRRQLEPGTLVICQHPFSSGTEDTR